MLPPSPSSTNPTDSPADAAGHERARGTSGQTGSDQAGSGQAGSGPAEAIWAGEHAATSAPQAASAQPTGASVSPTGTSARRSRRSPPTVRSARLEVSATQQVAAIGSGRQAPVRGAAVLDPSNLPRTWTCRACGHETDVRLSMGKCAGCGTIQWSSYAFLPLLGTALTAVGLALCLLLRESVPVVAELVKWVGLVVGAGVLWTGWFIAVSDLSRERIVWTWLLTLAGPYERGVASSLRPRMMLQCCCNARVRTTWTGTIEYPWRPIRGLCATAARSARRRCIGMRSSVAHVAHG